MSATVQNRGAGTTGGVANGRGTVEPGLVREIRDRIAGRYDQWVQHAAGGRLDAWILHQHDKERKTGTSDRRHYASALIAHEIETIDQTRLANGHAPLTDEAVETLTSAVLAELLGAGRISLLMERNDWTDLFIRGTNATLLLTNGRKIFVGPIADRVDDVIETIRAIANSNGRNARQFNNAQPLLSAAMATGERITATMDVTEELDVVIRRQTLTGITLNELVNHGTISALACDFLRVAIEARCNIVVSGGTGAGKTTLLNAFSAFLGPDERIVTIEDARELQFRSHRLPDVVSLEARPANIEGVGEITVKDLARHALRMSPTRVVCGEVRGAEVVAMVQAATIGNQGSLCTVHARDSENALSRLRLYLADAMPEISEEARTDHIAEAIDIVVHIHHFRRDGLRRVTSIREVTGHTGNQFITNEIFTHHPAHGLIPTGALSETSRLIFDDYGFDITQLDPNNTQSGNSHPANTQAGNAHPGNQSYARVPMGSVGHAANVAGFQPSAAANAAIVTRATETQYRTGATQ